MPISKLRPAFTFTEDRLRELQAVVPEAFADGKINWDTLREALGEALEDETKEHFGLFWPGKREARGLAALPSKGTLIPQPGQGVDEDNTHNLFIEGDNLEVLKLIKKSYANQIAAIFIDPPYNTGKEFVYPDDYSEPLESYLKKVGAVDEEGTLLSTNTKASGRFHSNWLNMMYPRLRIARDLLKPDGVIFASIDDNEIHHLRNLMDEVCGEENFISSIIWQHSIQPKGYLGKFSIHHNYILCYRRSEEFDLGGLERTEEHNKNYSNPDNDPNGFWRTGDVRNALYRPNLIYDISTPSGKVIKPPENGWRWSKETVQKKIQTGEIIFNKDETRIIRKIYLNKLDERAPETIWFGKDVGTTRDANRELKELFNGKTPFDTPKPVGLLKRILELSTDPARGDIVLDFFAGSSPIAQAVIEMNMQDGGNRRFICVQLPEKVDGTSPSGIDALSLKLKTISEVGKERIRRVIKKRKSEQKGKLKLEKNKDLGLKCFGLDKSNFSELQQFTGKDTAQLELHFGKAETPLIEGWKPENLLSESLLLQGFPLDSKVRSLPEFKSNDVQQITSEFVGHHLYICLDKKVKAETVAKINLRPEDILVCLDSALSNEAKVKLADQCNLKVI